MVAVTGQSYPLLARLLPASGDQLNRRVKKFTLMGSVECSHGGEFTGCRLALLATSKPLAMFEKTQVMNTILVTGGAGFIGSCFVRGLLAKEQFRVINFDWLTYAGNLDSVLVADGYRHIFVRGNIGDSKCVTERSIG